MPENNLIELAENTADSPQRIRNFLTTHKTKIAVAATAVAAIVVHRAIVGTYVEYLEENDLLDDFNETFEDDYTSENE